MEEEKRILGIDDSKKLSKKKREYLAEKIKEAAVAYAIEEVCEETIGINFSIPFHELIAVYLG